MAFTLRLNEREQAALEEIQEFLEFKTASSAIKEVICDYMLLRRELDNLKFSNNQLSNNHYKLCSSLKDVVAVLQEHDSQSLDDILSG